MFAHESARVTECPPGKAAVGVEARVRGLFGLFVPLEVRSAFRAFTEVPMDEFDCYNKVSLQQLDKYLPSCLWCLFAAVPLQPDLAQKSVRGVGLGPASPAMD